MIYVLEEWCMYNDTWKIVMHLPSSVNILGQRYGAPYFIFKLFLIHVRGDDHGLSNVFFGGGNGNSLREGKVSEGKLCGGHR